MSVCLSDTVTDMKTTQLTREPTRDGRRREKCENVARARSVELGGEIHRSTQESPAPRRAARGAALVAAVPRAARRGRTLYISD